MRKVDKLRATLPYGVYFQPNGNAWEQLKEWVDPGHIANVLVKHGIVAYHATALKMLGVTSCVAA